MTLRDLSLGDLDDVLEYESDELAMKYMPTGARDRSTALRYLERSISAQTGVPRDCYDLAIVSKHSPYLDRVVGRVGVGLNLEHHEAKLWYILRRELWSQGLITEACRALIDFTFNALAMHRVFLDIDPRNTASVKIGVKLGFQHEGTLRQNFFCRGEYTDSMMMGLLAHEWRSTTPR